MAKSLISKLLWPIISLLKFLHSVYKKAVCRTGQRGKSEPVLPITIYTSESNDGQSDVHPINRIKESEFASWNSWGNQDTFVESKNSAPNSQQTHNGQDNSEFAEPDFFSDMTPQISKTTKIRVKKPDNDRQSENGFHQSSRLSVQPMAPQLNAELTAWDEKDNSLWDEGNIDGLSWEADEAMRERKRLERLKRQQEQKIKKQHRDENRKDAGNFSAVKISNF